ncbi:MAG TPA: ferredoxin family protein [Clostridia bacterium]|nr:ferredoxin family protein [Clostridia bacterium]
MALVSFREDRCKGCGLCIAVCPRKIIVTAEHMNAMGFYPATVKDMDKCTGCALCARMCPDMVIKVEKEAKAG